MLRWSVKVPNCKIVVTKKCIRRLIKKNIDTQLIASILLPFLFPIPVANNRPRIDHMTQSAAFGIQGLTTQLGIWIQMVHSLLPMPRIHKLDESKCYARGVHLHFLFSREKRAIQKEKPQKDIKKYIRDLQTHKFI